MGIDGIIHVMIVDDSAVMRGLWSQVLSNHSDIVVDATAPNGAVAIEQLSRYPIDVVILDIEMPVMDGLAAIPLLLKLRPNLKIVMASTFTIQGSKATVKALTLGAADFVTKPSSVSASVGVAQVADDLVEKIRKLTLVKSTHLPPVVATPVKSKSVVSPKLMVIGASTGGPNALSHVLRNLTTKVNLPILIVQHMPPVFTALLAERFAKECGRPCGEAVDQQEIENGHIYIAPGDYHMKIVKSADVYRISLDNTSPQENFCRPAVDVLFRSAAALFGPDLLAVILTGMGEDGRRGSEVIAGNGGFIIAQDENSSVVWGMPGAVAMRGLADRILPLEDIPQYINDRCGMQRVNIG